MALVTISVAEHKTKVEEGNKLYYSRCLSCTWESGVYPDDIAADIAGSVHSGVRRQVWQVRVA